MAIEEIDIEESGGNEWIRRYPPLFTMVAAVLIVAFVLPSSLRLPQTNPTQTLEFAPVPPDDESDEDPPDGNVSSLGLGSSDSIEADAEGGDGPAPPPPPPPPQTGGNPVEFGVNCVGNPPRQTFDPLSPPCVPFYDQDQDNGGATYQGVTANEIRLLVIFDGGINHIGGSDPNNAVSPNDVIYDLQMDALTCRESGTSDADGCAHLITSGMRVWQTYFNQRFQTYGRNVHMYAAFASSNRTPEGRRADAAKHLAEIQPFAVVSFLSEGAEDDYLVAMARKGVLNFGSFGLRDADFFQRYAGMIWSYLPSIEQASASYISYVCKRVVNKPAVLAGGTLANQPRKLGLLHTTNQFQPGLVKLAGLVKSGVEACGGEIAGTATFDNCCLASDNGDPPDEEQQQMASFAQQGITTILWPGGPNGNYARSAAGINYFPEWILAGGDGFMDNENYVWTSRSPASFDGRAVAVSPHPFQPPLNQQICSQAFREIDPNFPRSDLGYVCDYYANLFQFFVGVQVAGPFIGPSQIDKGFHAIPQKYTTDDIKVPSCFYLPGDYTCIKDATALIYDAEGSYEGQGGTTNQRVGCYRMINGGTRYSPENWPETNVDADIKPDDPCTGYSESVRFNLR